MADQRCDLALLARVGRLDGRVGRVLASVGVVIVLVLRVVLRVGRLLVSLVGLLVTVVLLFAALEGLDTRLEVVHFPCVTLFVPCGRLARPFTSLYLPVTKPTTMPITGNSSYIPTTEEFLEHWALANGLLTPPAEITMPGAPLGFPTVVNRSTLEALLTDLQLQVAVIQSKANGVALVRGDLAIRQGALLDLFGQFTDKVRGNLPGTKWIGAVPLVPTEGDAQSRFCDPMDDAVDLWLRINTEQALGVGVALVLRDGVTQAQFATKVAEMKTVWRDLKRVDLELKLARGQRDAIQDRIYPILKQYRVVLPTFFAAGSAIVESLPRLTPEPGSDAVAGGGDGCVEWGNEQGGDYFRDPGAGGDEVAAAVVFAGGELE